ncbi:MAG: hypothetical protein ACRDLB_06920 [Actinomycetota bacterium]
MFLTSLFWIVPLILIGALIFGGVAIGTRREPDPTGRRPYAIYLLTVLFLAILGGLTALPGIGMETVDLIVHESDEPSEIGLSGGDEFVQAFYPEDVRAQDASALLAYVVVLGVSGALFLWHRRRLTELMGEASFSGSPSERTYTSSLYLTSFTALIIGVTAAVSAVLALGDIIAPGTLASGPSSFVRDAAYAQLVSSLLGIAISYLVLRNHWIEAERLRGTAPTTAAA